jgi:hypothetical protein
MNSNQMPKVIGDETVARIPQAHVEFEYSGTLHALAHELSTRILGNIRFVGENSGIWDEVPAVRLAARFLGLGIELGGENGRFALSMVDTEFPLQTLTAEQTSKAIVDVSGYVAYVLEQVPGVKHVPPKSSDRPD